MNYSFVSSVKANTSPIFTRPTSGTWVFSLSCRPFLSNPLKTDWRDRIEVGGAERDIHSFFHSVVCRTTGL
jgi:hypothetical protein